MQRPKSECQMQQEQSDELFARQLQEQLNSSRGVVHVPPPQSGPSKSVQEAADAAYARQLQQEIDLQEAATDAGNSRASDEDKIPVECPACTFVNYMKPSSSSKHWKCAQCSGPLMKNVSHSSPVSHKDLVECRVCHSLNKLPSKKSDVVLCGGCYQELGLPLSSALPVESEENQRTVQLRCGQCSVINAVTVGAKVKRLEFICGGCGVLNTMTLDKRGRVMRRVGDYEILDVVGEGAYSKVKRVRHIPTGCMFVAKIVPKTNQQVENDVRLEISILRRLKHKNIVQLIEILESTNNYYIILEPVMGGDLCDIIVGMDRPLPEQDVAALLIQLVAGVRACHRNGVAHRDLKPENLLLGTDGVLKISDFGLSRLHRESNFQASTNEYAHTLTGTLAYLAPEVFGGSYDAFRADIWSMGCIAYVLLTQNFPFGSTTDPHALEVRIRNGEVSIMPSSVSAEAKNLCKWLLSPRPEDRPTLDAVAQHDFFKRYLPAEYLRMTANRKSPIVHGANMNEFSSQVQEEAPSCSPSTATAKRKHQHVRSGSAARTSPSGSAVAGAATSSNRSSESGRDREDLVSHGTQGESDLGGYCGDV